MIKISGNVGKSVIVDAIKKYNNAEYTLMIKN